MNPDDEVCLCFRVSLRKVRTFCKQQDPPVASLISECLGAGTGCGWCVPFLKHLYAQHRDGVLPDLSVSPEEYAKTRLAYHVSKKRDEAVVRRATEGEGAPGDNPPLPREP
ncbi:MAG: (2Fe-2S)-binding protein [Phycisphaerales bacterium]|nr:(2Fe-2S)-binding protein [Phycisphaerales bacterium]